MNAGYFLFYSFSERCMQLILHIACDVMDQEIDGAFASYGNFISYFSDN